MRAVFYPYKNDSNRHIDILKKEIEKNNVYLYDIKNIKKIQQWKDIDGIYLNWFESIYNDNFIKYYYNVIKKLSLLILWKILHIKIIFVFHNTFPHDCKYKSITRFFIHCYLKIADKIVILSRSSKEKLTKYLNKTDINKKVIYIPLPNYIDSYSRNVNKIPIIPHCSRPFNVLFIGAVRPYKNVELLINTSDIFNKAEFVIAGRTSSREYEYDLNLLIKNKRFHNLKTHFQFISDEQMIQMILNADILALPYNIDSSLNSGTALLAFSLGRTVICPKIGTVQDISDQSLVFSYSYSDSKEEKENFLHQMNNAYNMFLYENDKFNMLGQKLLVEMKNNNNPEYIGKRFAEILIGRKERR